GLATSGARPHPSTSRCGSGSESRASERPRRGNLMATAKAGGEQPVFEPMKDADLAEVLAIERVSFASPWTRQSFLFDLHDNPRARSIVARPAPGGPVVGYGCTWLVHEELRINNIAVHPDWRGRAIGR